MNKIRMFLEELRRHKIIAIIGTVTIGVITYIIVKNMVTPPPILSGCELIAVGCALVFIPLIFV